MSDWDELGSDAVMVPLFTDFYQRIDASPIRRLFPPDLTQTREKQIAFQRMFWGGEDRYTPWRGHPRLRARHLPFPIGVTEAEAWIACMEAAVAASAVPEPLRAPLLEQLRKTAYAMINQAPAAGSG